MPTIGARPLGEDSVSLRGGLLGAWQQRNVEATVPHVMQQLRQAENLENLRRVADQDFDGAAPVRYPFLDTDIHKTLEGLAYVLARGDRDLPADHLAAIRAFYEECVDLLRRAQREDGYLNSYYQSPVVGKDSFSDLVWGHELYTLGHLIQAAVAADRRLGDARLLGIAIKFADLVVSRFGPDGDLDFCGHPEIEMALVELYRHTGRDEYLTTAKLMVDRRGRGTLKHSIFPSDYFQDAVPLRELDSVTGHAVRMVYLAAGATDVAIETGDQELLDHLEYLWDDMVASKLYVTGGLGCRHSDEAIGDRFELPSDRSYSETCAAIGTHQWAWRMYLASGDAKYLDAIETVLFNAFAVGTSADGTCFFYDNPLQRRPDHNQRSGAETDGGLLRLPWFVCPCCPPNVIRWVAELQDHLVVDREGTLEFGLPFDGTVKAGGALLESTTDYPFDGTWTLRVVEGGVPQARLRVPAWAHGARLTRAGQDHVVGHGWTETLTDLRQGEEITVTLPMPVEALSADPRVDAVRGSLAFRRGPLVLCAEQQDQSVPVDNVRIPQEAALHAVTAGGDQLTVTVTGHAYDPQPAPLYAATRPEEAVADTTVTLKPYYTWGNRDAAAMRVWFPEH